MHMQICIFHLLVDSIHITFILYIVTICMTLVFILVGSHLTSVFTLFVCNKGFASESELFNLHKQSVRNICLRSFGGLGSSPGR